MRKATFSFSGFGMLAAVLAGAVMLAAGPAGADGPAAATDAQWQDALAACRTAAFDPAEQPPQRATAIAAYARLLVARGQADKAIIECKQCALETNVPMVAEAALRCACQVARQSGGTVAAEVALLDSWKDALPVGPPRQAFEAARRDVGRSRAVMADLQNRKMVPEPARAMPAWAVSPPAGAGPAALNIHAPTADLPAWASNADGKGPPALKSVTLPVFTPPPWYATLQFPLVAK